LVIARRGKPFGGLRRSERAALVGLAAAMVAAAVTLLLLSRDFVFYNDEFGWLSTSGREYSGEAVLRPHNSHLIALPRLLYGVLPELFGPSYVPFRITAVIGVLLCGGLFFLLARRRIGGLPALAPTAVLLFMGTSWPVVLSPVGIPFLYSIAGGLGALLAIERESRRADLACCLLLVLAIAFHTFGTIFALGVAVHVLLGKDRLRRAWVFALPLAAYAAWWLWARQFDQGITEASQILTAPIFLLQSLAAVTASILGLTVEPWSALPEGERPERTFVLAPILGTLALIALGLRLRRGRLGRSMWAFGAVLLAFWLGAALSAGEGRHAAEERYMFPGAVMLLLVAAEAGRGAQIGKRGLAVLFAAAAIGVAGNAFQLVRASEYLDEYSTEARAELAMVELAGDRGLPALTRAHLEPRGFRQVGGSSGTYLTVVSKIGSFAFSLEEVRRQSDPVRADADFVLASLYLLRLQAGEAGRTGECERYESGTEAAVTLPLPAGVHSLRAEDGGGALVLRRFASSFTVAVGELPAGRRSLLVIPPDGAAEVWEGRAPGPIEVCSQPHAPESG
jgi:hypothetical protein